MQREWKENSIFSREPTVPLDEPSLFFGGRTLPFCYGFLTGAVIQPFPKQYPTVFSIFVLSAFVSPFGSA